MLTGSSNWHSQVTRTNYTLAIDIQDISDWLYSPCNMPALRGKNGAASRRRFDHPRGVVTTSVLESPLHWLLIYAAWRCIAMLGNLGVSFTALRGTVYQVSQLPTDNIHGYIELFMLKQRRNCVFSFKIGQISISKLKDIHKIILNNLFNKEDTKDGSAIDYLISLILYANALA